MAQQESKQMIVGLDIGTSKASRLSARSTRMVVWRSWASALIHPEV